MTPHLPMTHIVDNASHPAPAEGGYAELHLLRDCLALSGQHHRRPARLRLVDAVGEEFARKLLSSVTLTSRAS